MEHSKHKTLYIKSEIMSDGDDDDDDDNDDDDDDDDNGWFPLS